MSTTPTCFKCHREPHEIQEYVDGAAEWDELEDETHTPLDYMLLEEGTWNQETNHFCCTSCYIDIGSPSRDVNDPLGGWKAPYHSKRKHPRRGDWVRFFSEPGVDDNGEEV